MANLIAFVAVVLGGYLGWRRGTVYMLRPVATLLAGYLSALLLIKPFGWLMTSVFGLSSLVALPLGGIVGLFAGSYGFRTVTRTWGVQRVRPRGATDATPTGDRLAGMVIGGATAFALVLIAVWGGRSVVQLYGANPRAPGRPATGVARLSAAAAERAVYAAMRLATGDSQVAASMSAIIARPGESVAAIQGAARSQRVVELANDPRFRDAFLRGDARAMRVNSSMNRLMADEELLDAISALRLVPDASQPSDALAGELADALAPIGRTVSVLGSDEEFLSALAGAELGERLERGELLGVLADPETEWLLERVSGVLREQRRLTPGGR